MAQEKIIYTIKCGTPPYSVLTLPTICEYAERVEADLEILTDIDLARAYDCRWAHMLIFEIWKRFRESNYKQMVYLDLDIIIEKGTPDIFPMHPKGLWAAKCPQGRGMTTHKHAWAYNEWLTKKAGLSLDDFPHYTTYYNSGVILMDRKANEQLMSVVKPPWIHAMPNLKDQHQVNAFFMQSGVEVNTLDECWNKRPDREGKKHFTHYLTKSTKSDLSRKAKEVPQEIFNKAK